MEPEHQQPQRLQVADRRDVRDRDERVVPQQGYWQCEGSEPGDVQRQVPSVPTANNASRSRRSEPEMGYCIRIFLGRCGQPDVFRRQVRRHLA